MLASLLKGNTRFVHNVFQRNPRVFGSLSKAQMPKALWVGCSDSRLVAELVTSSLPGSFYALRTYGNTVVPNDASVGSVLEYSLEDLSVKLLVVSGHYACSGVRELFNERKGHLGVLLKNLQPPRQALEKCLSRKKMHLPDKEMMKLLVEANVLHQIRNLSSYNVVGSALSDGVEIAGLVYDEETGKLHSDFPELRKHALLEDVKNSLKRE